MALVFAKAEGIATCLPLGLHISYFWLLSDLQQPVQTAKDPPSETMLVLGDN